MHLLLRFLTGCLPILWSSQHLHSSSQGYLQDGCVPQHLQSQILKSVCVGVANFWEVGKQQWCCSCFSQSSRLMMRFWSTSCGQQQLLIIHLCSCGCQRQSCQKSPVVFPPHQAQVFSYQNPRASKGQLHPALQGKTFLVLIGLSRFIKSGLN